MPVHITSRTGNQVVIPEGTRFEREVGTYGGEPYLGDAWLIYAGPVGDADQQPIAVVPSEAVLCIEARPNPQPSNPLAQGGSMSVPATGAPGTVIWNGDPIQKPGAEPVVYPAATTVEVSTPTPVR